MNLLGSHFPPEFIEQHARNIIKKGSVLKLFADNIGNPKIKRLIIICDCNDSGKIGKVFINTLEQAPISQFFLSVDGRGYLDHDSFVDCSRIYSDEFEQVLSRVKMDLSCHIGTVSNEDMTLIIEELRRSKTISNRDKIDFGII